MKCFIGKQFRHLRSHFCLHNDLHGNYAHNDTAIRPSSFPCSTFSSALDCGDSSLFPSLSLAQCHEQVSPSNPCRRRMSLRRNHLYTNGPEVQGAFGVDSLPLTTVAHIISCLGDDVASLARLCRTSRVLYYMTLPQLWKRVVLRSHSSIHYRDDVPEGFGSASPFSMGLNALVTRNVSSLVRSLVLEGDYRSSDLEEYSRAGRVSESTMILNIAVRAAVDQCLHLEDFRSACCQES